MTELLGEDSCEDYFFEKMTVELLIRFRGSLVFYYRVESTV